MFPHRLAPLKAHFRDAIQEKRIHTEEQCLDWLEQGEILDNLNQNLDDLWGIPLSLERGELRLREWRIYLRKYSPLLKQVDNWSASGEIAHLLREVLPACWEKRVENKEQKRAKRRVAVRIMSPKEQQPGVMEFFRWNLGAPEQRISLKDSVYVEVVGGTVGGRHLRLNYVEWRRGEKLQLQMIPGRVTLHSIIHYVGVDLKLSSKNEAHIKDHLVHGHHDR